MSSSNKNGRFRCIHCGERFNLSNEDEELYSEGWFNTEPDCCDNCFDMKSDMSDGLYPEFSDADPGL